MSTSRSTAVLTALIGWMVQPVAPGAYAGDGRDNLYALYPDGSLKWVLPLGSNCPPFFQFCPIESTPAIGADGTIYIGSDDFNIYAVNSDGSLKWSVPTQNSVTASATIGTARLESTVAIA